MEVLASFLFTVWLILILLGLDRVNKNLNKVAEELKEIKYRTK